MSSLEDQLKQAARRLKQRASKAARGVVVYRKTTPTGRTVKVMDEEGRLLSSRSTGPRKPRARAAKQQRTTRKR